MKTSRITAGVDHRPDSSNPEEPLPPIQLLPPELMLAIFTQLGTLHVLTSLTVCKSWNTLLNDHSLWKHFLKRDLNCDFDPLKTECPPKELYRSKYPSYVNFSRGIYSVREIVIGSSECLDCVRLHDGEAILGYGQARRIDIWDLRSRTCKKTLTDDRELISRDYGKIFSLIPTNKGKLISCHGDWFESKQIAIWDLEINACILTIPCSADQAFLMGDKLVSHDCNGNYQIWDLESGDCEKTVERTAVQPIRCSILSQDEKKLIYGTYAEIEIWDLESGICTATLQGHTSTVTTFILTEDGKLISGETFHDHPDYALAGGEIRIWNLENGDCEMTLRGLEGAIASLVLTKTGNLISVSHIGQIKIWNLKSGNCETTYRINMALINAWGKDSLALTEEGELIVKLPGCSTHPRFKILDFNASRTEIFEELAEIFDECPKIVHPRCHCLPMSKNLEKHELAMQRFSRMPEKDREKIYAELYEILIPFSKDYPGWAEQAFHDRDDQASSPQQKAQAIRKYIAKLEQSKSLD